MISLQPLAVPAAHLWSLFLAHQPSPHWKSQIAHSDMHHPVSGINSLIHSVSLASHVSTHILIHLSAHLYYHHHSRHPSLLHSLLQAQNLPFQQILPTLDFFYLPVPDCLHAHRFIFSFTFLFIPCGRLNCLPVSFLLHVKYTLSYRIVSYRTSIPCKRSWWEKAVDVTTALHVQYQT